MASRRIRRKSQRHCSTAYCWPAPSRAISCLILFSVLARRAQSRGVLAVIGSVSSERRSEEHTSELQSLMRISYAVFCLKKKKKKHTQIHLYKTTRHTTHTTNTETHSITNTTHRHRT